MIDDETLSQSGIYRSTIKELVKIKEEDTILRTLVIAFDVKWIHGQEYLEILLKNERRDFKFEVLHLPNWKADTAAKVITAVLDKYYLWKSRNMIVADTRNRNSGSRSEIVIQFQNYLLKEKWKN